MADYVRSLSCVCPELEYVDAFGCVIEVLTDGVKEEGCGMSGPEDFLKESLLCFISFSQLVESRSVINPCLSIEIV